MTNKLERVQVNQRRSWYVSIFITTCLFIVLILMWYFIEHRYVPSPHQVSNQQELHETIDEFTSMPKAKPQAEEPIVIPTGVFLQSIEFLNSNTVQVSGYVWQKITNENLAKGINPGIVFPEAKEDALIEPAYTLEYDSYKHHFQDQRTAGGTKGHQEAQVHAKATRTNGKRKAIF